MTPLALRYAWRELRGGLRGFGVFIACIALGVIAIAGVGSVAQSLADGLSKRQRHPRAIYFFSLVQREATDGERSFLDAHGKVGVAIATPPTTCLPNSAAKPPLVPEQAVHGADTASLAVSASRCPALDLLRATATFAIRHAGVPVAHR